MASEQEVLESNEAELILESEVFKKAVKKLHDEYVQMWLNSDVGEEGFRELIHSAVKVIPEIERHLRIIVEKGKITKANLNRLRKVV